MSRKWKGKGWARKKANKKEESPLMYEGEFREVRKREVVFLITLLLLSVIVGFPAYAAPKPRLMIYTSTKEVLFGQLKDAFVKKHPDICVDYYTAGAGKIMAKLAAEHHSGKINADILWTSEIADFYQLKDQGLLERYVSAEAAEVISPVVDPEGYFTPARLGTIGIAYNTSKIKNPPRTWEDLLKLEFSDGFGIASPLIAGTSMVSISILAKNLGWDYIRKLRANGAKIGQGATQIVDDTAVGDLKACLAVDYIAINKIKEGAPIEFVYLDTIIVFPSPIGIIKGTPNLEAAKTFIDFVLSKEGQAIIARSCTLPVRRDIPITEGVGLIEPSEAVKRAMSLDYVQLRSEKVEIIDKFLSIMTKN